jgi:hypothetical protein
VTLDLALRPLNFCTVCKETIRHQPIIEDTNHCECRFDGPLPCTCACHRDSESLTFDLGATA